MFNLLVEAEEMKGILKSFVLVLALSTTPARGQTSDEQLRSFDALLQSNSTQELVQALQKAPDSEELMKWLRQRAEEGYVVPQFVLGQRLFASNRREGLAWYLLANLNQNLDMNQCKDFRRTDPIRRVLRNFELKVSEQEALLWADAIDDSLKIAARHDIGKRSKQPPWWICAPGEASPGEDLLLPEKVRNEKRNWIWETRLVRDHNTPMEIRFNANLNPDHYHIWKLDSKYWEGKLNSEWTTNISQAYFSAVWLDNDTLLFGGYRIIRSPGAPKKYDPIYRWDVRTGRITQYAEQGFGLCYYQGFISYYVKRNGMLFYLEGEFGKEQESQLAAKVSDYIESVPSTTNDQFHCHRENQLGLLHIPPSGRPLESGGRIKFTGKFEDEKRTVEYYPDNSDNAAIFDPFEGLKKRIGNAYLLGQLNYSEYLGASWLTVWRGGAAIDLTPVWILWSDGRVERHDIPPGPWAASNYSPAKGGWLAITSSGLYFLGDDKIVKILSGNVQAMRVSPNGCRVVLVTGLGHGKGTPMSIVDICQKGVQQ